MLSTNVLHQCYVCLRNATGTPLAATGVTRLRFGCEAGDGYQPPRGQFTSSFCRDPLPTIFLTATAKNGLKHIVNPGYGDSRGQQEPEPEQGKSRSVAQLSPAPCAAVHAMAFKSRAMQAIGKVEQSEDLAFDQLHENYKTLKVFADKQQKEMTSYLEKSRAICYASISSAEAYCAFFESSAGGATTSSAGAATERRQVAKGPMGFGMAIEDDGTVSGFTAVSGPAELAGVAIGSRIVGINGVSTPGKAAAIAELQRAQQDGAEFVLEPPPGMQMQSQSAVSSTFGATVREIKARNEAYSRDTRGTLEQMLIKEVLEPLEAFIAQVDAFQGIINDRERARELYDRYRAKVRDLGESGSARDPARLPRNEQKMQTALEEYQRCNSHAIAKLARFHRCVFLTFSNHLVRSHLAAATDHLSLSATSTERA